MRTVLTWLLLAGALALTTACTSGMSSYVRPIEDDPEIDYSVDDPVDDPRDDSDDSQDDSPDDDPPDDDPPDDDPPDDPPPDPVECGPNSSPDGYGGCVCDDLYEWCDEDPAVGCCAYGFTTFEIVFVSATVLPYSDPDAREPWDWDGRVPRWLKDLVEVVVYYVDEDATDWLDVLDFVYETAPELLEGTVPPDPFVELEIDGDVVWYSSVVDDSVEPYWCEEVWVTLDDSSEMVAWYLDEDISFDDFIEGAMFTLEDLEWYAGLGDLEFWGSYQAYDFTIAIWPIW